MASPDETILMTPDLDLFLRKYRRALLVLVSLLLAILPGKILYDSYSTETGFLETIHFSHRLVRQLDPELQARLKDIAGPEGYDGQFYAAMAMCPDLRCDGMGYRVDAPGYRFRRVGLPALAWVLGWGDPFRALHVYSLINGSFWLGLWVLLFRYTGFRSWRDHLLAFSLLWSAGTLISLERALTDLPAVVLTTLVASGILGRSASAGSMAFALLVKETSLLSVPALFRGSIGQDWWRLRANWISVLGILIPLILWLTWVDQLFPSANGVGRNNFGWPLTGIWGSASSAFTWRGNSLWHERIHLFLTLTALASLILQTGYVLSKPRPAQAFWRMGIGFGLLFLCLGRNVMEDYNAYLRVVLPLTFAFNFLIHRNESEKGYFWLFLGGNLGMMGVAVNELMGFFGHAIV